MASINKRERLKLAGRLIGLLVGLRWQVGRAGQQTIEIAVFQNVAIGDIAQAVLQRAYERLGITMKATPMPLRRALQMASSGEVDGDLMRTRATLLEQDQLIMIKVPVVHIVMSAYKRGICPERISIEDLTSKRVAYVRGTRILENLLPVPTQLATVNTRDSFRHLQRGIADYAVADDMESNALLATKTLGDICKIAEPLVVADLFHSLHKRHAELAIRLERVLKDMAETGEIAWIRAAAVRRTREAVLASP